MDMYCPRCGHETVITASDYVPADHDCLHCGSQLERDEVEAETEAEESVPTGEADAASAR